MGRGKARAPGLSDGPKRSMAVRAYGAARLLIACFIYSIHRTCNNLLQALYVISAQRHDWSARRQCCGHDGQRKSVAHMPTAATSTAVLRYGRITGQK